MQQVTTDASASVRHISLDRPEPSPDIEGRAMMTLAEELFPICRIITGNGVRQTLDILRRIPERWASRRRAPPARVSQRRPRVGRPVGRPDALTSSVPGVIGAAPVASPSP